MIVNTICLKKQHRSVIILPKEMVERTHNEVPPKEFLLFPHAEIERKWTERWVNDELYKADDNSSKPKYFVLDMFPYPSGAGLHVGHVEGYTATDIVSRYKRMNGYEVMHPMGWDAFGLPTENYAISTGENPHDVTTRNAEVFREQCRRTGFGIDWAREIDTSKEDYYKWTQNLFLDLYDNGLAYKNEAPANWCTGCNTVISNEQVSEGACERCSSPVESRNVEQWFFKITDYADRLINDLDKVNWVESTKEGQINWIGRTEGTEIQVETTVEDQEINLFMPQPELLYGASFIAIAPEHPNVEKLVVEDRKREVADFVSSMTPQSEMERKKQKAKNGVFTGNYAKNPVTGENLPIWIADYVLMDETGGVRAGIPSGFEKDSDFDREHELPVVLFDSNRENTGESPEEIRSKIAENLGEKAQSKVKYKLRDWNISRERYWGAPIPIINCDSCGDQPVPREELPVRLPEIDDYKLTGTPPLARSEEFLHTACPNC